MPIINITSDDIIDIEKPFKVKAGPGAGKTHWLANHIKNVLCNSNRLGCYRKIACITYTNTAVETILGRLNDGADRVEISTIHSFIYTNIVKPYIHFIAAQYDFNVKYMDGHDEHYISRKYIKEWIDTHVNRASLSHPYTKKQLLLMPGNLKALGNWLASLHYKFIGSNLELTIDNAKAYDNSTSTRLAKTACLDKLAPGLLEYKKIFWRRGVLHHDDVLFFGYKLIMENPFIITVLQAKFPYFFIDEFQDTSPVQTAILKLIADKETVVGVIGDKAQAIYSFQGAAPGDFDTFSLPGLQNYMIADNRRSTNSIVAVLNHLRSDISQNATRNVPGAKPVLFVGTKERAFIHAQSICGTDTLTCLSRDNVTVNAMKRLYDSTIPTGNLLEKLFEKDNPERVKAVVRCMKAVELAIDKRFKEAIKEMEKNNSSITDKSLRRKTSFHQLSLILSKHEEYKNEPLLKFYELVKVNFNKSVPNLTKGAIKDFYSNHTYIQIALFIDTKDEVSYCKTIHKAKGDEFDNVFLTMGTHQETAYLVSPNLGIEEQRIRYVAMSRARKRLFINIAAIDTIQAQTLNPLFDILR